MGWELAQGQGRLLDTFFPVNSFLSARQRVAVTAAAGITSQLSDVCALSQGEGTCACACVCGLVCVMFECI